MRRKILTEADKRKIFSEKEKAILEGFIKSFGDLRESTQDFNDEANVLVTKVANERQDVDSNALYDFITNNQDIIIALANELSKVEANLPSNEFIKILMSYPNEVIRLSRNI
jgi:hypothetical protein